MTNLMTNIAMTPIMTAMANRYTHGGRFHICVDLRSGKPLGAIPPCYFSQWNLASLLRSNDHCLQAHGLQAGGPHLATVRTRFGSGRHKLPLDAVLRNAGL